MANTTLTQTGAQVQSDLDKVEGLANIKTIGSGLSLSSGGELSASGGGGLQGYTVEFYYSNNYDSTQGTYSGYVIKLLDGKYVCEAYNFTGISITESIDNVVAIFVTDIPSPGGAGARSDYFTGTLITNGRYAFSIDGSYAPNTWQDLPLNKLVILCSGYGFDCQYND